MANSNKINNFRDFWPRYLSVHRSPLSQAFHLGGLLLGFAFAAALVSCGMLFFLVLAVVPAQIGAAIGHKLSPRDDRSVNEHPHWAALADLKMCALLVTGRLGREIARLADLSSTPSTPSFSAS